MGMSRKDALKRMHGLLPRVLEHLRKLKDDPDHESANHWRGETCTWIRTMEASLDSVGRKTAEEWQAQLDSFRDQLGETCDD